MSILAVKGLGFSSASERGNWEQPAIETPAEGDQIKRWL